MNLSSEIQNATSDFLVAPDWEKHFLICDLIKNIQAGDLFMTEIQKKLYGGTDRERTRAIELLQTGMQNNLWIIQAAHDKRYQNLLIEIVLGKRRKLPPEDENQLLNLIRAWGEAFKNGNESHRFPNFNITFEYLQRIKQFPAKDDNSNYIIPAAPEQRLPGNSNVVSSNEGKSKEEISLTEKLSTQQILMEMLNAIVPQQDNVKENQLVNELIQECNNFRDLILKQIESVSNEKQLMLMLQFNDRMSDINSRYEELSNAYQNRSNIPVVPSQLPNSSSSFSGLDDSVTLNLDVNYTSYEKPFITSTKEVNPDILTKKEEKSNIDDDFDAMFDEIANRNEKDSTQTSNLQPNFTNSEVPNGKLII